MHKILFFSTIALLASCSGPVKEERTALHYPETRKVDTVTDYFGTKIADPYRWLEDDRSAETAEWVKKENAVTYDYLGKIPFRDKIKKRLGEIWNFEKQSSPYKKGKYYFFSRNDGIQNQAVMYYKEGMNGETKMLLDPNTFSKDGTVALSGTSISKDAKYMAYGLSKAGSDWNEWYVMEIATGKKLEDHIQWMKFSGVSWDENGFYYSRFDAPKGSELSGKNEFNKLYYHKLGDTQEQDKLIYEDKAHPSWGFYGGVTDDGRYLILSITESTSGNALKVKDLRKADARFVDIVTNFDNDYNVVDNDEDHLIILTNKNASRYQLVGVSINDPKPESWKKIIPETKDLLEGVSVSGDKLIVKYLKDVSNRLYVYDMAGKMLREIGLEGLGTVNDLSSDKKDSLVFYDVVNFTSPGTIYKYNILTGKTALYFKTKIDFNSDELETKEVFFPSKDGTKIHMFLTMKKGTKLDGNNPCFLFGYGGFNISYTPEFRIDRSVFLENGGIYAVANLRGGGEYGEEWHKAGTLCNKQNVFDDFIAAAEYLIKEKYTCHDKLAMHGRSNGGLLAGAILTQRPDLAKVMLPQVGVLDMLRYHKFTIGWSWASDYGTSDNKEQFDCLIKYSPLHNVKETEYPATLIITGDHDDRVVPAHSFKFAATLQEKQKGKEPVLVRIDSNGGHGSGKPTAQQIEEYGDIWAFVFYNLGMTVK